MWNGIKAAPEDAILGLTEAFKKDPRAGKVNLGVGVYKDEKGNKETKKKPKLTLKEKRKAKQEKEKTK